MVEPQKERSSFGVLVIHGFSATLDSVNALRAPLKEIGLPVSLPLLAGHGALSPEALRGMKWEAWLADAEHAFLALGHEVERIILIGHSMGALISLHLAARYPDKVDSMVLVAPAIKLVSVLAPGRPFHFAAPLLSKIIRNWELKTLFNGPAAENCVPHYTWAPTGAIISLFELIKISMPLLGTIHTPVLIIHNRRESTVLPESAIMLYNMIATEPSRKSVIWLERSGHQIFCDCEREAAIQVIVDYVSERIGGKAVEPG